VLVYDGYMAVPMLDASVPVPVDLAADDGDLPIGGEVISNSHCHSASSNLLIQFPYTGRTSSH